MVEIPDKLKEVADEVHAKGEPFPVTVRAFLSWFGVQRRGSYVVKDVRRCLRSVKMITDPSFEVTYLDEEILLRAREDKNAEKTDGAKTADSIAEGGSVADPVPRIGMLDAANRLPLSIDRDSEVVEAQTLMLMNDYSQLPVMQGDRNVDGLISWRSIGAARALARECSHVRQCMDIKVTILGKDTALFDAIQVISDKEVILVSDEQKRICGLVTDLPPKNWTIVHESSPA